MDYAQGLAHVDDACIKFNHPATRAAAEKILLDFRQSPNVLPLCQYILDNSQIAFAQFNAASAICHAVVRDYSVYARSDVMGLRNHLLHYVLQRPNLERYVRQQVLHAIAVIAKRGWLDRQKGNAQHHSIEEALFQMFSDGDDLTSNIALLLSSACIDEFSYSSKSSAVGLTWEFHHKCKIEFEQPILLQIFNHAIKSLHSSFQKIDFAMLKSAGSTAALASLRNAVDLLERILTWDWDTKEKLPGTFADQLGPEEPVLKTTAVMFPDTWGNAFMNKDLLEIFFELYHRLLLNQADNANTFATVVGVRQCLLQLAGLYRPIFLDDTSSLEFLRWFLDNVRKLLQCPPSPAHFHFLAHLIRRRLATAPLRVICQLHETIIYPFLTDVGNIGVECLRRSLVVDVDEDDKEILEEAVSEILEGIGGLVDSVVHSRQSDINFEIPANFVQLLTNMCAHVVAAFVDSRMEIAKASVYCEEEESEEITGMKDWELFDDQLKRIGCFGRLDPGKTILQLLPLMKSCAERFHRLHAAEVGANVSIDGFTREQYAGILHEHTHWLVLICGHVLADSGEGGSEVPLIPNSLLALSLNSAADQDPVVALSKQILELVDIVTVDPRSPTAISCSPLVSESLFWYLERWTSTYLMADENLYSQMSANISNAFGKGSCGGNGSNILNFILGSVKKSFVQWAAEPDVLRQAVAALEALSRNGILRDEVLNNVEFPGLVDFFINGLGQFPEVVHRSLIKIIVVFVSRASDPNIRDGYFKKVTNTIERHLHAVIDRPDLNQSFQNAPVVAQVMVAIEMFDGFVQASGAGNAQGVFDFCERYFDTLIHVYRIYSLRPDVAVYVLRFFATVARSMDPHLLRPDSAQRVHASITALLKEYQTANIGKRRVGNVEDRDDEPHTDICTFLELLSNLMASEFEGFDRPDSTSHNGNVGLRASDVVFFGVSVVIPMIDSEILKIPTICAQYIDVIASLVEFHSDKLVGLPPDLLQGLMASLEFGIKQNVAEVSSKSYQSIAPLALFCHAEGIRKGPASVAHLVPFLSNFLQVTLDCLLYKDFSSELLDSAGEALFALMCCCRAQFAAFTNQILSTVEAPELKHRLVSAFESLESTIPAYVPEVMTSRQLKGFQGNLSQFLMEVRGFLRIR